MQTARASASPMTSPSSSPKKPSSLVIVRDTFKSAHNGAALYDSKSHSVGVGATAAVANSDTNDATPVTTQITDVDSLSISTITQDDNNGNDLLPFLQELRIQPELARSYRRVLRDNGYEDIMALDEADEDELRDLGIKVGHVKRMKRAAASSSTSDQLLLNRQMVPVSHHKAHSVANKYMFGDAQMDVCSAACTPSSQLMQPSLPPGRSLLDMDDSLQLSVSVQSMANAKDKIMKQAERIRKLESELSFTAGTPRFTLDAQAQAVPGSARKGQQKDATSRIDTSTTSPSPEPKRVLTAEERLQAHKERKQQENRYKELSGKWEKPTPVKKTKNDLSKKVPRKDELVDRLASNAQDRRRHSEIQQNVDNVLHRYATSTEEDEDESNGRDPMLTNHFHDAALSRPHIEESTSKAKRSALMERLGMTPNTRRKMHSQEASSAVKRTLRGHQMAKPKWRMSNEYRGATEDSTCSIDLASQSSAGYVSRSSQARCDTCHAVDNLEEDLDDPGLFYCQKCWDEYESSATMSDVLSQQYVESRCAPQSVLEADESMNISQLEPPQQEQQQQQPRKDQALWIVHDNPQLGNQVVVSGSKRMKCLLETKEPGRKNCVRIITGVIDYSGPVSRSDFTRANIPAIEAGTECLRLRNVRGYLVDHSTVESRLSSNKAIYEFHLDASNAKILTGREATMSAQDFLQECEGPVDVIIDPQCSPGEWYPQREASADNVRKLAPQFRSRGVGYIRLGDDMSRNGQAFLSSDACQSFFSNTTSSATNSFAASSSSRFEDTDISKASSKALSKRPSKDQSFSSAARGKVKANDIKSRQLKGLTIDFSDDEGSSGPSDDNDDDDTTTIIDDEDDDDDSSSLADSDDGTPVDNAGDILKELQSVEIAKDMKWNEKADLITRLGKVLGTEDSSKLQCTAALKIIQDVLGGKNVNVHVLRASVQAAGDIGERMGKDLVAEVSWRPIMLGMLKLLKSKQGSTVAKQNLKRLHGTGYTLANSLTCLSHALGLGKEAAGSGRRARTPASRAGAAVADVRKAAALKTANNVEVIEWLAETVEAERHMPDIAPIADKSSLVTISKFFLSHVGHRDPRCRRNVIDGLLHVVVYGIDRLGLKINEAQSMCSELQSTNPRGWKAIVGNVYKVMEEEKRGGVGGSPPKRSAVKK